MNSIESVSETLGRPLSKEEEAFVNKRNEFETTLKRTLSPEETDSLLSSFQEDLKKTPTETYNPSPTVQKYDERIAQSENFDKTIPGKAFGLLGKITPGESTTEMLKRQRSQQIGYEEKGLTPGQQKFSGLKDDLKQTVGDVARFAPFIVGAPEVGAVVKGTGLLSKAANFGIKAGAGALSQGGISLASKFVEELTKGDDVKKSAEEALDAGVGTGVVSIALSGLLGGGKLGATAAYSGFKKAIQSVAPGFVDAMASVPPKAVERAIEDELKGNSIFKGKFLKDIYHKLGKKAQAAMNSVIEEEGTVIGAEEQALRNSPHKIDTKPLVKEIEDMVAQKTDKATKIVEDTTTPVGFRGKGSSDINKITEVPNNRTAIDKPGLELINQFKKELKETPQLSSFRANVIKQEINQIVDNKVETVTSPQSIAKGILSQMAKSITNSIKSGNEEYKMASENFAKTSKLKEKLITHLKDLNVERNLKTLYNDTKSIELQELFQQLDDAAPEKFKFLNDLQRALVREPFEKLVPGKGGGSGGEEGAKNILRVFLGATKPLLLPLTSPKVYKGAIQAAPYIDKGIQGIGNAAQGLSPVLQRLGPPAAGLGYSRLKEEERRRY